MLLKQESINYAELLI